ncbi:hypothetical protein B0H14DRAFT_3905635 [Mycena olivaceomarginata]|nr:hypothetical protein B0H14DRAFT_3905635 [Mycena olivaceomarginata]
MADPVLITTTIITFATFIKDLIEVGQSIKHSIEKVGENRRRIRELTNDILHTLGEIADLSRGDEDIFQTPALLSALGNLKADMLHVHSKCRKISAVERASRFRGFGLQIKAWIKRDDVEAEIRRLKEHVNKCFLQFTAFSAARIEQNTTRVEGTTLRVEQTLVVNGVENQVRLQRLEGMMAQVLLETKFGQNVMNRTIEMIESDPTHQTLEFQYLSTEALRLVDSLQQLAANAAIILDAPLPDCKNPVFTQSTSPKYVLSKILGVVLKVNHRPDEISLKSIEGIFDLGVDLSLLRMTSESIAWELMVIQTLRRLGNIIFDAGVLRRLANAAGNLSCRYQAQLRWDLATESSRQSIDLWHLAKEISPDVDYRPLLATILITHSANLRETGQLEAIISIAEEAVALCRPMAEEVIQSGSELYSRTETDEYKVVVSWQSFVTLARALSVAGRHLEAYDASKEGFQTIVRLFGTRHPPSGTNIDSFIDQICTVAAEGGGFSLPMLKDCVTLFRDLTRIYRREFSSQFLRLLYAYVYLRSKENSPDFSDLRIFLEPNSDLPLPILDISSNFVMHLDDFNPHGGVIEDAIWAFYVVLTPTFSNRLIKSIFIVHFDQATIALQEVVSSCMTYPSDMHSNTLDWTMFHISYHILPAVSHSQRLLLLEIMTGIVGYFRAIATSPSCSGIERGRFPDALNWSCWGFWLAGSLTEALAATEEGIDYCSNPDDLVDVDWGCQFQVSLIFVLWDMGRIPEAIKTAQKMETWFSDCDMTEPGTRLNFLLYGVVQTHILRRVGKNEEALQILRRLVSEVGQNSWITDKEIRCYFHILLAELVTARKHLGRLEKDLKDVERAVAACRRDVDEKSDYVDHQKYALVHCLTTLSNCLAAVERNDEALMVAKEATLNAPHMWAGFPYLLRKEELGANAFHSLSLRLATSGQLEEALLQAEKAADLYLKAVSPAPRNLPTLARSLQSLASILWNLSRRDESIAACEEAVNILRRVVETEPYFLRALADTLDQLAEYRSEKGDTDGATSEWAEVRRKIELLPPEPDFLFMEFDVASEDEIDEPEDIMDTTVFLALGERAIQTADIPTSDAAEPKSGPSGWSVIPQIAGIGVETSPAADGAKAGKSLADVLVTPVEVKPIQMIFWFLFALLGVVLAVLWSRN